VALSNSRSILVHLLLLGRVALVRGVAAYSDQTFAWTICQSVGASACPVHCGKTADGIQMPFGIIGQTGLEMRQVVGFGDRSTGSGTYFLGGGANWGAPL